MKKKYVIIIIIIAIILLGVILLILPNKNNKTWIDNIIKKDNYQVSSLTCDGTTKVLDKSILKKIKKELKSATNNGPYLGDLNTCYKKIMITYDTDNLAVIEIIDDSSLIIKQNNSLDYYTYYTEANKLIKILNKTFK